MRKHLLSLALENGDATTTDTSTEVQDASAATGETPAGAGPLDAIAAPAATTALPDDGGQPGNNDVVVLSADTVDPVIVEMDKVDEEIQQHMDDMVVGSDAAETLGEMAEIVDAAIPEEAPIDAAPAAEAPPVEGAPAPAPAPEAAPAEQERTEEIATEGLSLQLAKVADLHLNYVSRTIGYDKRVMPAMEGFADKLTRVDATRVALENICELAVRVDEGLNIAQEGIVDKIATKVEMTFKSAETTRKQLVASAEGYSKKTPVSEDIKDPAWGAYIAGSGKNFSGSDVIAELKKIKKVMEDPKVLSAVKDLTECMKKLTKEVRGNWFVSNKNDIERIEAIGKHIDGVKKEVNDVYFGSVVTDEKSKDAVFKPLTAAEVKEIEKLSLEILANDKLEKSLAEFSSESTKKSLWSLWQINFRVKGMLVGVAAGAAGAAVGAAAAGAAGAAAGANIGKTAGGWYGFLTAEDIKKANAASYEAFDAVKIISALTAGRVKFVAALSKYIAASAK